MKNVKVNVFVSSLLNVFWVLIVMYKLWLMMNKYMYSNKYILNKLNFLFKIEKIKLVCCLGKNLSCDCVFCS